MKARSGAIRRKVRRRKAATAQRSATRRSAIDTVRRERDEALEQQAAISGILQVISNSPGDVQPVLDTVAGHAARICDAKVVDIILVEDGKGKHVKATFGELGDDGRHHGRQRAGTRLDLHHPAAEDRGRFQGSGGGL
jgi:hypothetical protein